MSDFNPPPQYAEYPRDQFQPQGEFDRPPGVYFEAIADAWTLVKRELGTWVALILVAAIIGALISAPFQVIAVALQEGTPVFTPSGTIQAGAFGISTILSMAAGALSFPVVGGLYYAGLKQVRGQTPEINDLFQGFKFFLPLLLFGILYNVLWTVACMLCLFPAVYATGVLAPGMLLIMDRGMNPIEALTESMRVLKNQAWTYGLFILVTGLAMGLLGFIACCGVGLLVTMPVYFMAMVLHYNYFWPRQAV